MNDKNDTPSKFEDPNIRPQIIATAIASVTSLTTNADKIMVRIETCAGSIAESEEPDVARAELASALRDVHGFLAHMVTTNRSLYDVVSYEDEGELGPVEEPADYEERRKEVSDEVDAAVTRALRFAQDHFEATGTMDAAAVMAHLRDGAEPSADGLEAMRIMVHNLATAAAVQVGGDISAILARTSYPPEERLKLVSDYLHDARRLNAGIGKGLWDHITSKA